MAVLGRRQPHAPLILRGGQFQPPAGRVVIVGQKSAQASADRYFRRTFTRVIIKTIGPRPSVALLLVVQRNSRDTATFARRPKGAVIIKKLGAPPSVAKFLGILNRSRDKAIADAHRLPDTIIKRAGGLPAVGKVFAKFDRDTIRRAYRLNPPPVVKTFIPPLPVVTSPPPAPYLVTRQARNTALALRGKRPFGPVILIGVEPQPAPPPPPTPSTPTPAPVPPLIPPPSVGLVDEDTLEAVRLVWLSAVVTGNNALVDEDTMEAIRVLWLSAPAATPTALVDEDTLEAIRNLWNAS